MALEFLAKLKIPHVFVLIFGVIFVCAVLTYVIPSGSFQRETKIIEGNKRSVVVAGTYREIPKAMSSKSVMIGEAKEGFAVPVSAVGFLSAVPRGMEAAADIIFFIFVIGGVIGILRHTGVITATISRLLDIFQHYSVLLTIVIMLVIAVGGSTLGMGEEFIPLVPIFLLISKRMGYDRIFGLSLVILAAQVGFASATTNPFTIGVAQGIAEIPLYSGTWFRVVFFLVCLTITIVYVLRYGARMRRDPSASLMAGDDFDIQEEGERVDFNRSHGWILTTGILIFAGILIATVKLKWWMPEMGGGFILIGIIAALFAKLSLNETANAFVKGMEDMVVAALVVGFARGIEVVLSEGMIMDTIIYHASNLLQEVPRYVAIQGMFIFQTLLNFLIPSGSGQAAVTMPLMAPIADVIGVTRQTAVFAFQCGDGFSNTIIPTSGILMSMLALAKIPYQTWLRFMLPLLGLLLLTSAIFLTIAVAIDF